MKHRSKSELSNIIIYMKKLLNQYSSEGSFRDVPQEKKWGGGVHKVKIKIV
jgi:hypothetical protein